MQGADDGVLDAGTKSASLKGNRSFAALWFGQSVSQLGTQVTQVALPLVAVVTLDGSAVEVAAVVSMEYLPSLLFGLIGGVLVDRADQRRVMLVTDLARAAVLLAIPIAYGLGVLSFPLLFAVTFVMGTATLFFDLAYQSAMPRIVDAGLLLDANGRLQTTQAAATAVGPPIGSVLVQLMSAPAAVIADAVSFAVSWAATLRIHLRPEEPVDQAPGTVRPRSYVRGLMSDLKVGLDRVRRDTRQVAIIGVSATGNAATIVTTALLPLWLRGPLRLPVWTFGLVLGFGAVGAVGAGFALAHLKPLQAPWRRMSIGLVLAGCGLLLVPLAAGPAAVRVLMLGIAEAALQGCLIVVGASGAAWRQANVPGYLLARVISVARTVNYGVLPLASIAGGALAEAIGLQPVLFGSAALLIASPAWFALIWTRRATPTP